THVRSALDVGMSTQRVDATSRSPHVAEQQLQHRCGPDDLRPERVLCPPHRVHDRGNPLHVSIFADGSKKVGSLRELIFRYAGDALNHFRRVARILLFQQLKDATGMFQREVISYLRWQDGRWLYRLGSLCPGRASALTTLPPPTSTLSRMRHCRGIRPMGGHCCGGGSGNTAQVTTFLVIPGG